MTSKKRVIFYVTKAVHNLWKRNFFYHSITINNTDYSVIFTVCWKFMKVTRTVNNRRLGEYIFCKNEVSSTYMLFAQAYKSVYVDCEIF